MEVQIMLQVFPWHHHWNEYGSIKT